MNTSNSALWASPGVIVTEVIAVKRPATSAGRSPSRRRANTHTRVAVAGVGEPAGDPRDPQRPAAGQLEQPVVEVEHAGRLAVDDVDVQSAAMGEHVGDGGDVGLVVVEDPIVQTGEVQHNDHGQ